MELLLIKFILQYLSESNVGNNSQNKGQCVGLVSVFMDLLGIPHEYGNAKDLLTNADTTKFDVIHNNPADTTQFPGVGAIMVFDGNWGSGFGHTGVIVKATGTWFDLFEQNDVTNADPTGACEILHHSNYNGVLGWLMPKLPPFNTHGLNLLEIPSTQAVFDTWSAVAEKGEYVTKQQYDALQSQKTQLQAATTQPVLTDTHRSILHQIADLLKTL